MSDYTKTLGALRGQPPSRCESTFCDIIKEEAAAAIETLLRERDLARAECLAWREGGSMKIRHAKYGDGIRKAWQQKVAAARDANPLPEKP